MKKTTILFLLITLTLGANAQNQTFNENIFEVCSMIFVLLAFMIFIIGILKRMLEYRLKNKIIDKGIPDHLASSILQTEPREDGNSNIKWFTILAGTGAGLAIVNLTQPLGIHSAAIMCGCISLSFLGYYLFQQKIQK